MSRALHAKSPRSLTKTRRNAQPLAPLAQNATDIDDAIDCVALVALEIAAFAVFNAVAVESCKATTTVKYTRNICEEQLHTAYVAVPLECLTGGMEHPFSAKQIERRGIERNKTSPENAANSREIG